MKDALTITVTDHKLREELRKLKGADNTLAKYEEPGSLWDLDHSTGETFNQNKIITSQDICTMNNHLSKTNSNDRFIKLHKFCGKGKVNKCNKMGPLASKYRYLQAFLKVYRSRNHRESHRSSCT